MESRQFAHPLQARRLKAVAADLHLPSPDRREAFHSMMIETTWLSVEDIAAQLSVNKETVRRWIRSGRLNAVKAGRQHRITRDELLAFLKSERVATS